MHVHVVDALETGRLGTAHDLTFEYLAMTEGEAGRPVPQDIQALPAPLRTVLHTLASSHEPPGALLLALAGDDDRDTAMGTVAMRRSALTRPTDAVVQRLYVRPQYRRGGIATALMAATHGIARARGFHRLTLNVMATRTGAVTLYESLGYEPMDEPEGWPWGGVWLYRDTQPHAVP
jgi:GNAT superfamily N-acetyltransferase